MQFSQHYGDPALNAELTDYFANLNQLNAQLATREQPSRRARQALTDFRSFSEKLAGYRLPFPWWQRVWFGDALSLEDRLTECLPASAKTSDAPYPLVAQARWAASTPVLDWQRIELPAADRALSIAVEIDDKLGRALTTSPPDSLLVGEAWSALRRVRYLLPRVAKSGPSAWLEAEHLLSRALGLPGDPVETDYSPRQSTVLTVPITCWSDSVSVTSGEEPARANLAKHCARVTEDLGRLRVAGGAIANGVRFEPYTNISPWGRNPTYIPMVFDYLLVVRGSLTLQASGTGITEQEGPPVYSQTFVYDQATGTQSQNIADAYQSWWRGCNQWLWQKRRELGPRWVAGHCGEPAFTDPVGYWKNSQMVSRPRYWTRQE